jgi:hypothetical protein
VLEYIYIFFTYEVAAREFPGVFMKAFTHGHTPERLATVHVTFYGRNKRGFVLELNNSINKAVQSRRDQTCLVLTGRT